MSSVHAAPSARICLHVPPAHHAPAMHEPISQPHEPPTATFGSTLHVPFMQPSPANHRQRGWVPDTVHAMQACPTPASGAHTLPELDATHDDVNTSQLLFVAQLWPICSGAKHVF